MKVVYQVLFIFLLISCGDSNLKKGDLVGETGGGGGGGSPTTYGDLSGVVTNARTGAPISGVSVSISGTSFTTTTNGSGSYSFLNVPVSTYSIVFSEASYIGQTVSFDLLETNDNVLNLSLLTPAYAANKIAIVLTWGEAPADLDSHLYVPTGPAATTEVFYSSKGDQDGTLDTVPFAGLDNDETGGKGPETIVLDFDGTNTYYPRTYRYFVNDYYHPDPSENLGNSSAIVRVYTEGILSQTFQVNKSATEKYWHVLDIDQNGNIISQDSYSNTKPATLY